MNASLLTYVLGGALAASLGWHLRAHWAHTHSQPTARDCCVSQSMAAGHCAAVLSQIDLDDEQRAALTQWTETACKSAEAGETRAKGLLGELHRLLAAQELDSAKAFALVDEIGRLHAEALRDCVGSVIEVRRVLRPEQVEQLMRHCAPGH
jgi:Spy/CpxP family protein refolding chaperone